MTQYQINLSLETEQLQLKFWDKLTHYGIVGIFFFIPAVFLFTHLTLDYLIGNSKPFKTGEILFMIIPSFLGVLFYRLQKGRLKFRVVPTKLPREKLVKIIEEVAKELEWIPWIIDEKIIVAKTHPSFFSGSWGEQVTILFDKDKVLVNSICDPDKSSSVVSMGRNKLNTKILIEKIEKASR